MSAAIALREIGIDTHVYERVTENKPVGAAISVWSNGVKCLNYLGLAEETAALGGRVETMSYIDGHSGATMCRFSMQPLIDEVGQRPYPIARAELQSMLMNHYGMDDIAFGMKMVSVEDGTDAAVATFADGTTVSADLIIGADGANSITREYVLGGPVTRRYAGYVNVNGLVPVDEEIGPATEWTTYVADGQRVSVMPVAGDRFYFFFDIVGEPSAIGGDVKEMLRRHFDGWAPGVHRLIDVLDPATTNRVEILDLDPFDTWVRARRGARRRRPQHDTGHRTGRLLGDGGCGGAAVGAA